MTASTLLNTSTYVPQHKDTDAILTAFKDAASKVSKSVTQAETSLLMSLAVPYADYCAYQLAKTGAFPSEKIIKEFFQNAERAFDTGKATIKQYFSMARKVGVLTAKGHAVIAWNRVVDSTLEIKVQAERPQGRDWQQDVLADVASYRPMEKVGKGDKAHYSPRASRVLPMSHKDIGDAYARFVLGKPVNPDGTIIAEGRTPQQATTKETVISFTGASDLEILQGALALLRDAKRRNALGITNDGNIVMVELLQELDACITSDGDFVANKLDDSDTMVKGAESIAA